MIFAFRHQYEDGQSGHPHLRFSELEQGKRAACAALPSQLALRPVGTIATLSAIIETP